MATRRGQALIELAVGLFTFALVATALCGFAVYIARSLRLQNTQRGGSPEHPAPVEVGAFAADYVFGATVLKIEEPFYLPERSIATP
jgi:hypothetical protein